MPTYFSPDGNPEIWEAKPAGYYTVDAWQAAHPPIIPAPLSKEQLLANLRVMRDAKLSATDKYLLPDYPISNQEELVAIKAYRQALRDLLAQPSAPWDGGGELTPWPPEPEV